MLEDHTEELRRTLTELGDARLTAARWDEVSRLIGDVETGTYDGPLREIGQILFEGKVRGRFQGRRRPVEVAPTKQTSVLPWVGLVCGGVLAGVGALLGGGVILIGVVALALFVFGIAFAGSRVAHRRSDDVIDLTDAPVAMPPALWTRVLRLRSSTHPAA